MLELDSSIKGPGGKDVGAWIGDVAESSAPTVNDLLYAGQRQRTRILDRTARGVDYNNVTFPPYSKKGPYYYYPGRNSKNRRAAALRTAKKLGVDKKNVTRLGIKFDSYDAFKRSLGRMFVDLRGPSAPHMLQALVVKVAGFVLPINSSVSEVTGDEGKSQKAEEIIIGIYGPEAERANAHQTGSGVPQRKFLGASEEDKRLMLEDIFSRVKSRVKKALRG